MKRRWLTALKRGGRCHTGDSARWQELQERAGKIVEEKHAMWSLDLEGSAAPLDVKPLSKTFVPGDHVAVRAEDLLGIEAAYSHAMAELISLRDSYNELRRVFAIGYANSNPFADAELDALEQLALKQGDECIGRQLIDLVNEVRGYRTACRL